MDFEASHDEDFVSYRFFSDDWKSLEHLSQLRREVLEFVKQWTADYLWHREPFQLRICVPSTGTVEPHLRGRTAIGDNVEDEWFITFLVLEITQRFSSLTASIHDADGDFMLIEAAHYVPPFLDPENSSNRIWIRNGSLHLVLPGMVINRAASNPNGDVGAAQLSVSEGLAAVRHNPETRANEQLNWGALRRAKAHPARALTYRHAVRCFLPVAGAAALRGRPALVAAAVQAYASPQLPEETAAANKALAASAGAGAEMAEVRVTFTRQLYAQLTQARLPVSGLSYPAVSARLPSFAREKASDLGAKLVAGMEIAYRRCQSRCEERRSGSGAVLAERVEAVVLESLLLRLERLNYFDGAPRGSQAHDEKVAAVREMLRRGEMAVGGSSSSSSDGTGRSHLQDDGETEEEAREQEVLEQQQDALAAGSSGQCEPLDLHLYLEAVRRGAAGAGTARGGVSWTVTTVTEDDDRENWMHVSAADLEEDLALNFRWEDPAGAVSDMAEGLKAFVGLEGTGLEGAEAPELEVNFDCDRFLKLFEDGPRGAGSDEEGEEYDHDDVFGTSAVAGVIGGGGGGGGTSGSGRGARNVRVMEGPDSDDEAMSEPEIGVEGDSGDNDSGAETEGAGAAGRSQAGATFMSHSEEEQLIRELMCAMDMELEDSAMGESFKKKQGSSGVRANGVDESGRPRELSKAEIEAMARETFERTKHVGPLPQQLGSDDEEDEDAGGGFGGGDDSGSSKSAEAAEGGFASADAPEAAASAAAFSNEPPEVDVDMNVVMHLLESLEFQHGGPGPVSNLLREMGLAVPVVGEGGWDGEDKSGGGDGGGSNFGGGVGDNGAG